MKKDNFYILGKIHQLQLISMGQNLSLTIDRNHTSFIRNHGDPGYMNTSEISALYISGLPNELADRALRLWHIREAISFQGICIIEKVINIYRTIGV